MKRMSNAIQMKKALFAVFLCAIIAFGAACSPDDLGDGLPDVYKLDSEVHPEGWSQAGVHGQAFIKEPKNCNFCHGEGLAGGLSGVSCEQCHAGWQTENCLHCHGGFGDNPTAAPPKTADGKTDESLAHLAHVLDTDTHEAFDCNICHNKPENLSDAGHLEDRGDADVNFGKLGSVDLAATGAIVEASCTVYCHGESSIAWESSRSLDCTSCHGGSESDGDWSGAHSAHTSLGYDCTLCHMDLVDADGNILDTVRHVNGTVNVAFGQQAGDASYQNGSCNTVDCHGGKTVQWEGEAAMDCTSCHDVESGNGGHGAHRAHLVAGAIHNGYDCSECHKTPAETLDEGHINGTVEVRFSPEGFNAYANYHDNNGQCSNIYCHSDGQGGGLTDKWKWDDEATASFDCASCHGDKQSASSLSGFHGLHIDTLGHDCSYCHKGIITADGTLHNKDAHINGIKDVALISGEWNADEKTCTNTCHEEQKPWRMENVTSCNSCHGDETGGLTGNHALHVNTYGHQCSYCHQGIVSADKEIQNEAAHMNGQSDVKLLTGDYDPTDKSCTNTCHSEQRVW